MPVLQRLLIALTAACLGSVPAVAAPFSNGGFEAGALAPWFLGDDFSLGGQDWNATPSEARTGTFSATNAGNQEIRQDFGGIATDVIVQVSFWILRDSLADGGDEFAFRFYYDDGTRFESVGFRSGLAWEFFEVTSALAPGKTLTGFGLFGNNAGCPTSCTRTFLDDVSVVVPEPSTLALLGAGLLVLARWTAR